jgi:hypothetical protein
MKTKLIKGKVDILLVDGLPNGKSVNYKYGDIMFIGQATESKWKYINTLENLTEDEADGLVESDYVVDKNGYCDYLRGWFDPRLTAVESFQSLLDDNEIINFNPSTTLIFVKQ